jgi:hypothetical protein
VREKKSKRNEEPHKIEVLSLFLKNVLRLGHVFLRFSPLDERSYSLHDRLGVGCAAENSECRFGPEPMKNPRRKTAGGS